MECRQAGAWTELTRRAADGGMAEPVTTIRVVITGCVQGVWYRGWTVDEALERGLSGWVRNRRDGSVEAVAVGPREAVDSLIEAVRRGPRAARVDAVDIAEADEETLGPSHGGFALLPTV
jgi:acylphosphatase